MSSGALLAKSGGRINSDSLPTKSSNRMDGSPLPARAKSQMDGASLLTRIQADYPDFVFRTGPKFKFRPPRTIYYENLPSSSTDCLLLHELGHAILGHKSFKTAPERLRKEVEAWNVAKKIAPAYGVLIDDELVQSELDSYRDWLHAKSKCPRCLLTRYQTVDGVWHCPYCDAFLKR